MLWWLKQLIKLNIPTQAFKYFIHESNKSFMSVSHLLVIGII